MAEYLELYMDRGSDFDVVIELSDDDTNLSQNLVGYVVTGQMRRSLLSVNASADLVCTVSDAANGKIDLSLDAANTSLLRPGSYFFDVKSLKNNHTTRIVEGVIFVTHGITQ